MINPKSKKPPSKKPPSKRLPRRKLKHKHHQKNGSLISMETSGLESHLASESHGGSCGDGSSTSGLTLPMLPCPPATKALVPLTSLCQLPGSGTTWETLPWVTLPLHTSSSGGATSLLPSANSLPGCSSFSAKTKKANQRHLEKSSRSGPNTLDFTAHGSSTS